VSPVDESTRVEGVRKLRQWLNENRKLYNEMRKRLNNQQAVRNILRNLQKACEPILAYNPMNESHVAVFVVARTQCELEGFFKDLDFVDHYEEKQQEMKELTMNQAGSDAAGEHSADPNAPG